MRDEWTDNPCTKCIVYAKCRTEKQIDCSILYDFFESASFNNVDRMVFLDTFPNVTVLSSGMSFLVVRRDK